MDLGMILTLIVLSVILLGAALFVFTNINNIHTGKKQHKKDNSENIEKAEELKEEETKN